MPTPDAQTNPTGPAKQEFALAEDTVLVVHQTDADHGVDSITRVVRDEPRFDGTHIRESETTRTIKNVKEHKESLALRNAAYAAARKHCSSTILGLLAPRAHVQAILDDVALVRAQAEDFNARASVAHVTIRDPLVIAIAPVLGPSVVARIALDVRTRLCEIHDALRSGDRVKVRAAMVGADSLVGMASGYVGQVVRDAVACAVQAQEELSARTDGRKLDQPEEPLTVGQSLELGMIVTAIDLIGT